MSDFARTPRTTLKRLPARGVFDRPAVHAILDEGLVCHVGFVADGQPFVIPTTYARIGDRLYVHGSAASRMLRALSGGIPVAVTVTLLDGLVLARSTFHHSMNYRSVVVLGEATLVEDPEERTAALEAIVEHVVPGRSRLVRGPNEKELLATSVLRLDLVEVSAKVRTGPPIDDEEDLGRDCWAGVLPLRLVPGEPVADPLLPKDRPPSADVTGYRRPGVA
jgi:nitroimidazol reductase NimA-like FMN-containing flavoprotein (pyridoxamine 5'-phosphate oxidase superfamily)